MHEPLYDHPIAQENIARLKRIGVEFVEPEIVEGKAKIASTAKIVQAVITRLSFTRSSQRRALEAHRVLVPAGPTVEHIDPVRIITNRSSGKMGVAIAEEAWSRGAETTLILGPGSATPPPNVKTVKVETTEEMLEATLRELKKGKHDLIFAAAAPSDYRPSKPAGHKISTREEKTVELELEATPKIIREIRNASPDSLLVAFKTEHDVSNEQPVRQGF